MLKGFLKRIKAKDKSETRHKPQAVIIARADHTISREAISHNALKVLYRLNNAGYGAYLVGGCVRDLLLGRRPKDFDIATDARPEDVRKLFKNCRLIGKRFRLAHVVFGKEIIEVATFRTHHENAEEDHGKTHQGMIVRDNVYGSIEDDVFRRDFSINALYYNIADFSIVDFANGMADIQDRTLRMIGNPDLRFQEDPVRMLRALRFMGKLNLNIHHETEQSLMRMSPLLQNVSSARLFQDVLKFFQEGATLATFHLLQKYHLFEQLFAQTAAALGTNETKLLLHEVFRNTDERFQTGKSVSPAFLLTVLLWRPIVSYMQLTTTENLPPYVALERALQHVLHAQTKQLAIPRKLLVTVREICMLQHQFNHRHGKRPYRTLEHPRFRAGYDLLLLREKAGEPVKEMADWWTAFYHGDTAAREKLLKNPENKPTGSGKRKPRRRKKTVKAAE